MKKKIFLLYSVTLIVGVALIFGINAYTTDTYRTSDTDITVPVEQVPTEITTLISQTTSTKTVVPTETTTTKVKKKPCSCCAERITRLKETIRKARERKQNSNNIGLNTPVSTGNGKAK